LSNFITGNFSVSHQAFSVIESTDIEIYSETFNILSQKVKNALLQDEVKADLLEDLIDLLHEMQTA
jgi:NADPH-dependent 7-cyano-7-deazaguanine reductase QueF-like protein